MARRHVVAAVAAFGLVAAPAAASFGSVAGAQEDPVTLTIGVAQDLDSPNVTAGYLVTSFEVWNLEYGTLTDKAADDFATIPGLAESWEGSDDGLTYTYTLREGLEWSDGTPLTADDVVYTINRSRDEEWINHASTTVNLDATALDERTVEITSSVPDPKLPTMDVYIVPKHIYEPLSADDVSTYDALDGVGSGPYVLNDWSPGESWTMTANPNYWGWDDDEPAVDRIVYRVFTNGDAMVAALQQGEIDAAHGLPAEAIERLDTDDDIVAFGGVQGTFTELGMNGGASGIGDGHPALTDVRVRQAIAHAIDRDALFDRVILGLGTVGTTMPVSPDPSWQPEVPDDMALGFDPEEAGRLLDEAGYTDGDGDGVREGPDGDLVLRYIERTESVNEPALRELITGWLADVGIGTEVETYDDTQLTDVLASGNFDLFVWGWTPYVDPDTQLSYFVCDEVTYDPDEYIGFNDTNWCDETYDELYAAQKTELDPDARHEIVADMLLHFYEQAAYVVLFEDADAQAYRTDRFDGWLHQPAETGPVLFTNSSPTYANLSPVEGGGGGGADTGLIIGVVVVVAVVVLAGGGLVLRARATRDERD